MWTYVDKVNDLVNLGDLLGTIGDHIAFSSRNRNREFLLADSCLDLCKKQRIRLNLGNLLRVGYPPVVFAITAGILPVDVYQSVSDVAAHDSKLLTNTVVSETI